jgi:serine/threonine-protein kinase RsbT
VPTGRTEPDADEVIPILTGNDVGRVRRAVGQAMEAIGASKIEMTRMVTAASELARNTLTHGGGGEVRIALVGFRARRRVELTFSDRGPGIADLDLALKDGYSSGGGRGRRRSGAPRVWEAFENPAEPRRGPPGKVASWTARR